MISERLMNLLESVGELTETELAQEYELCEEDIISTMEDLAKALKIMRMIRQGDGKGLVAMRYGK